MDPLKLKILRRLRYRKIYPYAIHSDILFCAIRIFLNTGLSQINSLFNVTSSQAEKGSNVVNNGDIATVRWVLHVLCIWKAPGSNLDLNAVYAYLYFSQFRTVFHIK
jgi:hypothetical protein